MSTVKVVINGCFGGFSLSPQAQLWLFEKAGPDPKYATPIDEYFDTADPDKPYGRNWALNGWRRWLKSGDDAGMSMLTAFSPDEKYVLESRPEQRDDPLLVQCVETLGKAADGAYAKLVVVEVPADASWHVEEYDGNEHVAENHRTWG